MSARLLRLVAASDLTRLGRAPVDDATLAAAGRIVADVRERGEPALRAHAERLDGLAPGAPFVVGRADLAAAVLRLPPERAALLARAAERIRRFAEAQRRSLADLTIDVPGGRAGHRFLPVERAGCYAPGGRYPLPSSVLMTAVTARAAGVEVVWVASPRPSAETLAAAGIAGADGLLCAGGAHAIAALAFGAGVVPACDMVVGPGNRWVTAAKQIVAGHVGIDFLAGPSELVVLADPSADPALVAADLLAQAEHDPDALPILVALSDETITAVENELARQLENLSTGATARAALAHGFAVRVSGIDEAIRVCDLLAPEHLEVMTSDAPDVAARLSHAGAVFVGAGGAEVFADYGVGPNHVLPTGGTARSTAGLSVLTFLRARTWLAGDPAGADYADMARDAAALARLEGLEAHARAAERRLPG